MKLHKLDLLLTVALLLASAHSSSAQTPAATFDLVITNGHIIDGTGSPWYAADLGIRDGKVAAIGNLATAPRKRTIDAAGKVVAPGFIDMLGQSEFTILIDPRLPSKIYQGITTEITGEGGTIAPLTMPSFNPIAPATSTTTSLPTGEASASILRVSRKQGMGHQSRQLRRRHASPPHGARRRQCAAFARAT